MIQREFLNLCRIAYYYSLAEPEPILSLHIMWVWLHKTSLQVLGDVSPCEKYLNHNSYTTVALHAWYVRVLLCMKCTETLLTLGAFTASHSVYLSMVRLPINSLTAAYLVCESKVRCYKASYGVSNVYVLCALVKTLTKIL